MAEMRSGLRAIAEDTVRIAGSGRYQAPGGGEVRLATDVAVAVAGPRLYLPDGGIAI
jgi:hypothetical protein